MDTHRGELWQTCPCFCISVHSFAASRRRRGGIVSVAHTLWHRILLHVADQRAREERPRGCGPCMAAHQRTDPKTLLKEGTDGGLDHKGVLFWQVWGDQKGWRWNSVFRSRANYIFDTFEMPLYVNTATWPGGAMAWFSHWVHLSASFNHDHTDLFRSFSSN